MKLYIYATDMEDRTEFSFLRWEISWYIIKKKFCVLLCFRRRHKSLVIIKLIEFKSIKYLIYRVEHKIY